jgi:hypothetical protein
VFRIARKEPVSVRGLRRAGRQIGEPIPHHRRADLVQSQRSERRDKMALDQLAVLVTGARRELAGT